MTVNNNKDKIVIVLLCVVIVVVFGALIYYYHGVNLSKGAESNVNITKLSTPVPLQVSTQDQSSDWNVYSSPQFKVTFKYPNFQLFGAVDGGVSTQGQADAQISIRPDSGVTVDDLINAQIANQNSGGGFSATYGAGPIIEVVNVDNRSGDLIVATSTIKGDIGKDMLVVEYPEPVTIINSVVGSQVYQYLVLQFSDMNLSLVKEIIGTIRFL
jgi:hypothetical protein